MVRGEGLPLLGLSLAIHLLKVVCCLRRPQVVRARVRAVLRRFVAFLTRETPLLYLVVVLEAALVHRAGVLVLKLVFLAVELRLLDEVLNFGTLEELAVFALLGLVTWGHFAVSHDALTLELGGFVNALVSLVRVFVAVDAGSFDRWAAFAAQIAHRVKVHKVFSDNARQGRQTFTS